MSPTVTTTQPSYLHELVAAQPHRSTLFYFSSLSLIHLRHPRYEELIVPFDMLRFGPEAAHFVVGLLNAIFRTLVQQDFN